MVDDKRKIAVMLRKQTLQKLSAEKLNGLTPGQLKAARGLLDWSQSKLAAAANVTDATIRAFEVGRSMLSDISLAKVHAALDAAGIVLLENGVQKNGEGVQLRPAAEEVPKASDPQ